jgi:hypothetical protein
MLIAEGLFCFKNKNAPNNRFPERFSQTNYFLKP